MTLVALRPVTTEDSDRLFDWRNRDDVRAYMYSDGLIARETHDRWFAGALAAQDRRYWIIEWDGLAVGLANLADISKIHEKATWAYYLADPSTRGKGIGACVEYLMIEKVFGEFALEKLWCEVLVSNEAVWKLHESFGFVREAEFRRHVVKSDGPHDVYGLGLLKTDWLHRRDAARERLAARGFQI